MIKLISSILVVSLSLNTFATDIQPAKKQTQPILIKGGNLHTVTDGNKLNHDMLIEAGLITKIGQNLTAPANAQVIDASGKQVYPGLIGLTSNVGLVEIGAVRATRDNSEVGRATP